MNKEQVAEQISEDVEKVAKLRDFKSLAENIYNQACISACLDGVEGVDYEITNDVKIINILLKSYLINLFTFLFVTYK